MLNSTEVALVHILERPTTAWVARLRSRRLAVHAGRIAARVVDTLCMHVIDARPRRKVLVAAMVRFVRELTPPDRATTSKGDR
jgi:hypothetical protein